MNTVLLVGAGFSHAISNHVPLTWQLGPAVRPLDSDPRELAEIPEINTGQDLERWLSKIAEPQPYLDERDHALNTARFIQATRQIRNAVAAGQATAMTADMPEWLDTLLRFMHIGNHTVISLNYDTLIESATTKVLRTMESHPACLPSFRGERVRELPPLHPPAGLTTSLPRVDTFRLTKLHGSLDTWWIPGDSGGETIGRLPTRAWGAEAAPESWDPDKTPAGKEPFIVPPASAKSAYYANPITRQLWRDAHEALMQAKRVCIVGYSFPLTDLTIANLFADTVVRPEGPELEVVNIDPDGVKENLVDSGVPGSQVTTTTVDPSVGLGPWIDALTEGLDLQLAPPSN